MFKRLTNYFNKAEIILLSSSVFALIFSFLLFDRENYLTLIASVLGALALILCAKGNPVGQILILVFSTLYGIISFSCGYYGEVMTYGAIAKKLGTGCAQAVGGAVGHNPISIIIPCHRVVGAQGKLTGYAGGFDQKIFLLRHEGADPEKLK